MFFPQLSGYPIIDVNISYIFEILPLKIIIEVFIFSFLEYNIVFYSSNLENLNMILYLFKCFNYPFNDSIYYQNILSISNNLFMSETSTFINNSCPTMIGVLSDYDPEFLSSKEIEEHFVLDIDNKNFFFFYQEENGKVEEIINLQDYIKNCFEAIENYSYNNDKDSKNIPKDEIHLYECIKCLMEKLMNKSIKITSLDYNKTFNKNNSSFFNIFLYEVNKNYIETNKIIQEAFYLFIINIFINLGLENVEKMEYFGKNNNVCLINNYLEIINDFEDIPNSRMPSFVKEYYIPNKNNHQLNKRNIIINQAKKIFLESLMNSSKYNKSEIIDLYKIPYTFINEFIYYFQFNNIRNKIYLFKLIDQFYGKIKLLDFEELANKKIPIEEKIIKYKKGKENKISLIANSKDEDEDFKNIYLFSFDNFSKYYQNNLRAIINREQEDDKENFSKVKSINKQYKIYKRNNYFLSQKILDIYITFANNNVDNLLRAFNLIRCIPKKSEKDKLKIPEKFLSININIILNFFIMIYINIKIIKCK